MQMRILPALLSGLLLTSTAAAQKSRDKAAGPALRAPATIARVDRAQLGAADAVIVRRPAADGSEDMILVHENTSPEVLARAAAVLLSARRSHGLKLTREMRTSIPAVTPGSESTLKVSPGSRARAQRDLQRLDTVAPDDVPGFGRVRAFKVQL